MEAQQLFECEPAAGSENIHAQAGMAQPVHYDFVESLWQRACCIVEQYKLSAAVNRASRLARLAGVFISVFAAVFGIMGISYAVSDSQTINIYWLLLVLLGFNVFSVLLWLAGISLNVKSLAGGVLARLTLWFTRFLERRHFVGNRILDSTASASATQTGNIDKKYLVTQADQAWLSCHFSGRIGKWRLSQLSHQLWLVYLLSGLFYLLLLLSLRQYDFVWGTTLLSDNAFIKLTSVLSTPLQMLGFATPDLAQIEATRIGSGLVASAQHRYHWAQFLIGSLLCFGIIPRMMLWFWSAFMLGIARRSFRLDEYLPYYIKLRTQLMPLAHGQIVDADTLPPPPTETDNISSEMPAAHRLPAETLWVAVELDERVQWPPAAVPPDNILGVVVDRESHRHALQNLQAKKCSAIAVAVSASRLPDRGVQRIVCNLMHDCAQRWLVLLTDDGMDTVISGKRLAAWYRLAEACEIPADRVMTTVGSVPNSEKHD